MFVTDDIILITVTAIKKGAEIVKSLLKRTKSIDSNNPNTKIYLKRGGIEKLKRDFYKNKPMEIRGFLLRNGVSMTYSSRKHVYEMHSPSYPTLRRF